MIYFDQKKPNKYNALKRYLTPIPLASNESFKRYGNKDGSYVLLDHIHPDSFVLSYGVGNDPDGVSFENTMAELGHEVICYDGSIDKYPTNKHENITFHKEHLTNNNLISHFSDPLIFKKHHGILKMDIEGFEYSWLENIGRTEKEYLFNFFDFICIELHGLIEEVPDGWKIEPEIMRAKQSMDLKVKSLKKLEDMHFCPIHLHANNHGPRHADFPDSLEVTYMNIRDREFTDLIKDINSLTFPIDGLDEPNYNGRPDYVLDWWVDNC